MHQANSVRMFNAQVLYTSLKVICSLCSFVFFAITKRQLEDEYHGCNI